ncbi:cysteine protease StiP family protein [Bacillus sp. 31A1R]|uniref:Cysteine protease StiP family protein n=1 Tax=Robertmurraya mangrovi TaxID=3098077 RepID=A0ABU5J163_9BACI|nr:cysteine protease StiP family protein [Bacillus sp. 31A1R]MDZ5473144.1 cysteine protease StiP family protein [Bacillus sp. 31A1R]
MKNTKEDVAYINSTYREEDVIFLLKDLSNFNLEGATEEREARVQRGEHYSESLPLEYQPPSAYMHLYYDALQDYKKKVALYIGVLAEQIYHKNGKNTVLVSLARAGTPIGILIRRYLIFKYNVTIPHYSISIIRGKGFDSNAVKYIIHEHPNKTIQFVDGWSGKGAISKELTHSCEKFFSETGIELNDTLALLADPGHCSTLYGTRDDFLIPNACLNSTVTGLVSRTVLNSAYIGPADFHGAKFYQELKEADVSNQYVDVITEEFEGIKANASLRAQILLEDSNSATFKGLETVKEMMGVFEISNINFIKPGVGETTRVLLRRVPWKILIKDFNSPYIKHILLLAEERKVEIVHYPDMDYTCCGLIKPLN